MSDVLIVGAGFTGAAAARVLADAGVSCTVIDRRPTLGGNAHDYVNANGIRIHTYGPHLFHTNSQRIFSFLSRFTDWVPYEHRVVAVYGHSSAAFRKTVVKLPIIRSIINTLLGTSATSEEELREVLAEAVRKTRGFPLPEGTVPKNSLEVAYNSVGDLITNALFSGYTSKHWGRQLSELSTSVISRIPVRFNDDDRYFTDAFQALPAEGYVGLFEEMLSHPLIKTQLRTDFHYSEVDTNVKCIIYTGSIDDYYNYSLGALEYRSVRFEASDGVGLLTPEEQLALELGVATVNFTSASIEPTRITNFGKLPNSGPGNWLCKEYPTAHGGRYYPVPSESNLELYAKYQRMHQERGGPVIFAGRLGTYRYLNMDQACANGMKIASNILNGTADTLGGADATVG